MKINYFVIVLSLFVLFVFTGCDDLIESSQADSFSDEGLGETEGEYYDYGEYHDYYDDGFVDDYDPSHYFYDDNPYDINFQEVGSVEIPSAAQRMKYNSDKLVLAFTPNANFELVNIINPRTLEKEIILWETTDLFNIMGIELYNNNFLYYIPHGQYMLYRRDLRGTAVENINPDYEYVYEALDLAIDERNNQVFVTRKVPGPIIVAYDLDDAPSEGKLIDLSEFEDLGLSVDGTTDVIMNNKGVVYAMLSSYDNDVLGDLIKINSNTLSFEEYLDISSIDEWFSQRRIFLSSKGEVIIPQRNPSEQIRFVVIDENENIEYRYFENYADNYVLSEDGEILLGFVRLRTVEDHKYYLTAYYLNGDTYSRVDDIAWSCKFPDLTSYVSTVALYIDNYLYVQCIDGDDRYLKKFLLELNEK